MEKRTEGRSGLPGKRLLALLLCLCMVGGLIPAPAHAQTVGQLCGHHKEHTPDCGYAAAVQQPALFAASRDVVIVEQNGQESWRKPSLSMAFFTSPPTDQKVTMTLIADDPTQWLLPPRVSGRIRRMLSTKST